MSDDQRAEAVDSSQWQVSAGDQKDLAVTSDMFWQLVAGDWSVLEVSRCYSAGDQRSAVVSGMSQGSQGRRDWGFGHRQYTNTLYIHNVFMYLFFKCSTFYSRKSVVFAHVWLGRN